MIEEAIAKIEQLATNRDNLRAFTVPQEPADVYFMETISPNGERHVIRHVGEPKPRAYTAQTLTGLVEQIKYLYTALAKGTELEVTDGEFAVFVHGGVVTLVADESARRHKVRLSLPFTEAYQALKRMVGAGFACDQRALLWAFRTVFAGEVGPAGTIADFKQIRFKSRDDGSSDLKVGKESLGRDVEMEITAGGKELPETIQINATVYEGVPELAGVPGWKTRFDVAVDINMADKEFVLKVMPGVLELAMIKADQMIADEIQRLVPDGVHVLVGSSCNL